MIECPSPIGKKGFKLKPFAFGIVFCVHCLVVSLSGDDQVLFKSQDNDLELWENIVGTWEQSDQEWIVFHGSAWLEAQIKPKGGGPSKKYSGSWWVKDGSLYCFLEGLQTVLDWRIAEITQKTLTAEFGGKKDKLTRK